MDGLYSKSNQNLLFDSFYAENQARFVSLNWSYSSPILNNPTRFNCLNNSRIVWDSIFRYNLAYVWFSFSFGVTTYYWALLLHCCARKCFFSFQEILSKLSTGWQTPFSWRTFDFINKLFIHFDFELALFT